MSLSSHAVLVTVCDEYDARGDPPGERAVAVSLETTPSEVGPVLCTLCRTEFLQATPDGYRPTVTAREFLELEVELDDVVVVDPVEE